MTNAKPRLALAFGILVFLFSILVKLRLTLDWFCVLQNGNIAISLLLPCAHYKKLKLPNKQILILAYFAGVICFWCRLEYRDSKFKCYSSFLACQFSSSGWVLSPTYSLTQNQQLLWIGTTVALFGMAMLVGLNFLELDLIRHFIGRISRSFIFDIFTNE
jgi:hypothetical protein